MPNVALRFEARRSEGQLEEQFLNTGGDLGSAAARDETDFGITHGTASVSSLVTEAASTITVPLSKKAYTINPKTARLSISSRTRLNVTTSRIGAGINGTLVQTMSGQASVPLYEVLGVVSKSPFAQIASQYPSWPEASSVISTYGAVIVDLDDGHEYDIDIVVDPDMNTALSSTQEIVKTIYDASWKVRDAVVYASSPNLTKSVMRVPFGIDGSGYSLSAQVNDRKFPFNAEALNSILESCIGVEIGFNEEKTKTLLSDLSTLSPHAVRKHSRAVASSLSTMACYLTPYRVDGRAVVLPTGTQMVNAESWLAEAPRTAVSADDCDGSAALVVSAIEFAKSVSAKKRGAFPYIDALSTVSEFYVSGVSVLGANAGHADAADEKAAQMAGHAVAIMIPKTSVLFAMQRGDDKPTSVRPISDETVRSSLHKARFDAFFPKEIVSSIPESERKEFLSLEALTSSLWADPVEGFQPRACEGTTPASSDLYVHSPHDRFANARQADADDICASFVAPNITRSLKTLDSSNSGGHRFYDRFVELSLPTSTPLFTSGQIRKFGSATAHLVLSPDVREETISVAGASPKDLATGDFLAIPLWRVDGSDGNFLDLAISEANANQLPPRKDPMILTEIQTENLKNSMGFLSSLSSLLKERDTPIEYHGTQHIISYAALVNNPSSIDTFRETISANKKIFGDVDVKNVNSIAKTADGKQAGVFACVNLFFPM